MGPQRGNWWKGSTPGGILGAGIPMGMGGTIMGTDRVGAA